MLCIADAVPLPASVRDSRERLRYWQSAIFRVPDRARRSYPVPFVALGVGLVLTGGNLIAHHSAAEHVAAGWVRLADACLAHVEAADCCGGRGALPSVAPPAVVAAAPDYHGPVGGAALEGRPVLPA